MISNLINSLTFARILLAAVIFILLTRSVILDSPYFVFYCWSHDYFDGYLARKYNAVSQLGEILDPIADKILIVFLLFAISVNLTSYYIGFLSATIITREIWVGALRDFNARQNRTYATKVTFLGKIKTTIQLTTISTYIFGLALNNMLIILIGDILLFISLLVTVYTGINYTYNTFLHNK